METTNTAGNYPFLADGGEMGECTRNYNWSATPLGTPDQWPLSLRTTVGIVLHSAFPMFLFWGSDLICFYNDAYRGSLGNDGKHPAVGKRGADVWPEIWDFIGPMIQQVIRSGKPTFFEDQLVPIYRNGRLEDVYWTYSYSPVYDDDGRINGVFVTTYEATQAVLNRQKLEVSEARFRSLIREAPAAMLVVKGNDLVIETVNQALLRILDRGEDIVGKPLEVVMPELIGQPLPAECRRVLTTGVAYHGQEVEGQAVRNGRLETMYFNVSYSPLSEEGRVTGVMQVVIEVTEQVLARQKTEESEARFRSLIEQSPVATCLFVGPDLVVDVANEGIIRFFGRGPSIVGKPIREILTGNPGDSSAITLLRQVLSTGEPFTATAAPSNLTIDGIPGTYYFDLSLKPLRNETGAVYAVLETATDVTEQVLARQKLEEAESDLRVAVEMAQLGTWSIDVATNGLTYSERLIEWFGYNPAEQDYRLVIPILDPNDQERVAAAVARALDPQSGGVYNETYTVIHPQTGKKRVLHAQGKTVFDATGKAVRLNGTAQDITMQRELQLALEQEVQLRTEELAASNKELVDRNEAYAAVNADLKEVNDLLTRSNANLEKFAYVASHDLQEPLRKIQSFGDILKNSYGDQLGDGVTYLERMQSAASRMSTLIRDLLTFSRIAIQRETVGLVPISQVIDSVLNDLDLRIQETGAVITVAPLPTLPGDQPQLEQLFQNLVSNALKFRRAGVPPVVTISSYTVNHSDLPLSVRPVRVAAAYYRIDVTDNGIGFDEKYVDRIFQVFQRLHSRNEFAGTGIGLAICEKVVANHGGAITATSQPGQGATFSAYFPI